MSASRHNRGFWVGAAREVELGRSIAAVAERLQVRPGTLAWWCWRLRREGKGRKRTRKTEFLPVVHVEAVVTPSHEGLIELETHGVQVRIGIGTNVRYIAALMRELRTTC